VILVFNELIYITRCQSEVTLILVRLILAKILNTVLKGIYGYYYFFSHVLIGMSLSKHSYTCSTRVVSGWLSVRILKLLIGSCLVGGHSYMHIPASNFHSFILAGCVKDRSCNVRAGKCCIIFVCSSWASASYVDTINWGVPAIYSTTLSPLI